MNSPNNYTRNVILAFIATAVLVGAAGVFVFSRNSHKADPTTNTIGIRPVSIERENYQDVNDYPAVTISDGKVQLPLEVIDDGGYDQSSLIDFASAVTNLNKTYGEVTIRRKEAGLVYEERWFDVYIIAPITKTELPGS